MEDVLERWRSEKTAGYLSAAVAAAEPDPGKAALFREMADAAEEQAGILAKELHETPPFSPRSGRVSRPFSLGPSAPAPCAPSSRPQRSAVCQSIAARCRPDIRGPLPSRTWVAVTNLMAAARSGQGCSTSTTGSCPIPVAGAAAEPSVLILTGVAGLLAGAFSMAAGEFISMLSQKEMFEHQIAQELWQRSSAWRLAHTLDRHGGRGGDLRDRVAVQRRGALIARPSLPDHWTTVINSAEFGTDYYTRTAVAKSNIFINRPRETRYFYQDLDKRGARLTGVERYTVTFAEAPPVEGFWSITLYNQHHFFAPNELNRFSLGTKSKGLRLEGDGSLIIMCRPRARARTRSRTSCRRLPGSSPSISAPIGRFPRSARGAGRRPPWCRWVRGSRRIYRKSAWPQPRPFKHAARSRPDA
jgi:hypothetical protein